MPGCETCPGCATTFDARKALVSGGVPPFFSMFTTQGVSMLVRCPHCWRQFRSTNVRLFGFLSPAGFAWVILGLVALCIAIAAFQSR